MSRRNACLGLATCFLLVACSDTGEVTSPEADPSALQVLASPGVGVQGSATGGGHFFIGALDIQFSMSAIQTDPDGTATGRAHHSVELGGELVEFYSEVTCVTFDPDTGRAWIGGVVTQNNSTHPSFTGDTHEVGDDIWWRVVDYGEGGNAAQADRSTFVGFENDAGIITSREYCDEQIWPDGDARTNAVTQGNIQVRVRR